MIGNVNAPSKQGVQSFMREINLAQDRKFIQNEIEILKSYTFARKAISELPNFKITYVNIGRRGIAESKLYNRAPFMVVLDSLKNNTFNYPVYITILSESDYFLEIDDEKSTKTKLRFKENFQNEKFSFKIFLLDTNYSKANVQSNKYYFLINTEHSLAVNYRSKLILSVNDEEGSVIKINIKGYNAQQEVDYLNKLTELYLRNELNDKNLMAENMIHFIDNQLKKFTDSLKLAEQKIQRFKTGKGIVDLSLEGKALFERLESLYASKNTLKFELNYLDYI
jgi:hypothetical protein